jgi:iron complex transport system permease protein
MTNTIFKTFFIFFAVILLSLILMSYGREGFSISNETIVWQLRFPKVVIAFFAGGMLAVVGLLLQIYFNNPLAGSDLLGVNAGASFGVALAVMGTAFIPEDFLQLGQTVFAIIGAMLVFSILVLGAQKKMSNIGLIVIGLLVSSFTASLTSVLVSMSPTLQIKNFLVWSMGSFEASTLHQLPLFVLLSVIGLIPTLFLSKSLNQFLLGETYALSMGLNIQRFKMLIIFICTYLVSIVTVYCGPIGFIGIISTFIVKKLLKKNDTRFLIPAVFLMGSFFALGSEFIIIYLNDYSLSTNAILGLVGAPIITLYLFQSRKTI